MKTIQDVYYLNMNAIYRTGGYFRPQNGAEWKYEGNHSFCQNIFYLVTEGTFCLTIDKKEYQAKPGDWFFIPAGVVHTYHNYPNKPMAKFWMHFDLSPSNAIFNEFTFCHCINVKNNEKIFNLFEEFVKICDSTEFSDILRVKSIILDLLAKYLKLTNNEKQITVYDEKNKNLQNVISFINENYRENLSTEQLAKICYLHPTHFIRAFKQKMAQTPQQYIVDIRMEKAKQLLDKSDKPISMIAEEVGYYDPTHFCKVFKRYYSITPMQQRKKTN